MTRHGIIQETSKSALPCPLRPVYLVSYVALAEVHGSPSEEQTSSAHRDTGRSMSIIVPEHVWQDIWLVVPHFLTDLNSDPTTQVANEPSNHIQTHPNPTHQIRNSIEHDC